jgi:hypothetical protein
VEGMGKEAATIHRLLIRVNLESRGDKKKNQFTKCGLTIDDDAQVSW